MSMIETVAVAGASGFVGRHVVRALLEAGLAVRASGRDRAKLRRVLPEHAKLTLVEGEQLIEPQQTHAVVNSIGIIRETRGGQTFQAVHVETTRKLVQAARAGGARRFIQISALGVSDDGVCDYQRTKWQAETIVRRCDLDWTIFRPGLIHGMGSGFIETALGWVRGTSQPWFFLPFFQRGRINSDLPLAPVDRTTPTVQPVAVEDVAKAVVASLQRHESIGEIYNLVGSERVTWPEMLHHIRDHVPGAKKKLRAFGVPADVAAAQAWLAGKIGLGSLLPFDRGMALMGGEDSVADLSKSSADLAWTPRPFRASFQAYARAL
jgi:nucleoside-diphosphate-sugar epimerase